MKTNNIGTQLTLQLELKFLGVILDAKHLWRVTTTVPERRLGSLPQKANTIVALVRA